LYASGSIWSALERIEGSDIKEVVVTDTIPLSEQATKLFKNKNIIGVRAFK